MYGQVTTAPFWGQQFAEARVFFGSSDFETHVVLFLIWLDLTNVLSYLKPGANNQTCIVFHGIWGSSVLSRSQASWIFNRSRPLRWPRNLRTFAFLDSTRLALNDPLIH
jgi:hypothetical protein